jgi:hypothetical protein
MVDRTDGPSAAVRIRVMKRDRFTCTYCGVSGSDAELEIDHIHAVAKGGSHHISNLTTCCRACNQEKGTGTLEVKRRREATGSAHHPLVGMFVTTSNDEGFMQYQGKILGVDGEICLVQLYSAWDGGETNVETWQKSFVYSDRCKLFALYEAWIHASNERFKKEQPRYQQKFDKQMEQRLKRQPIDFTETGDSKP